MEERFTDLAWTEGDFNKATTSPSQTALSNWMWYNKYQLFPYLKFKQEKPSISFKAGTFVHDWFQTILVGQAKIDDVEFAFKTHIEQFEFEEKHKMNKYMGQTLNLANEGFIDCVNDNEKKITEHKNRFGSVSLKPLKKPKKDDKPNENRIGDWVYSKSQAIKYPQFTHCIQTAIYSKHFDYKYKPYLIYVGDSDYTIFTPDNCWELTPKGLQYFFKKFIQINIQRQEMLRMANGDIRKLAMIIGVDWSEIRNYKSNFLLENYHEEDMQRLEDFYEKL